MVHICSRILLSLKKEGNNAICSHMDRPKDYHTKWSKSERERQVPFDIAISGITNMWNLKYGRNKPIYKTKTDSDTEKRLVASRNVGGAGEGCTGSLGLVNANNYIINGWTTRSYCIAQRNTFSVLR